MATDYDFSDEFTTAQYLPPGRNLILMENPPPPRPPTQSLLQRIAYALTPQLSTHHLPFVVLIGLVPIFFRHCRVLISDCWHWRVRLTSFLNVYVYALILFVVAKGIWDTEVLRGELAEVYRALNMCMEMATMPPERGTGIVGRWIHEDE